MTKAIKETLMETSPDTDSQIGIDDIVQDSVNTSSVFMRDQVKRICTKTDNALKAVMVAHLKARASKLARH